MTPFSYVSDALDRLSKMVVAAETFAIEGNNAKRDEALRQASELAVDALQFLPAACDPRANVYEFRSPRRPNPHQPGSAA